MSGESEYVEGALYRARLYGEDDYVLIYYVRRDGLTPWHSLVRVAGIHKHDAEDTTDITGPLRILGPDERVVEPGQVVLDLDVMGASDWQNFATNLRSRGIFATTAVADQIESQVTPPRIPEPGFGAVVEASVKGREGRFLFSRVISVGTVMWQSQDAITCVLWDSLIDPVVKREAVES